MIAWKQLYTSTRVFRFRYLDTELIATSDRKKYALRLSLGLSHTSHFTACEHSMMLLDTTRVDTSNPDNRVSLDAAVRGILDSQRRDNLRFDPCVSTLR